jgi:hypothetical protein
MTVIIVGGSRWFRPAGSTEQDPAYGAGYFEDSFA